jgi:hypothetical protein
MTVNDAKAIESEKQRGEWSWIGLIHRLCGGDITKTDLVLRKTFMECLIWLSYEKIKNENE